MNQLNLSGMELRQALPLALEPPLKAQPHHKNRTGEQITELRQEASLVLNLADGFVLFATAQQVRHRIDHQCTGKHLAAGLGIQAAEQIKACRQRHQLIA